ncbi:MAG TPA: cation:proton antiporter [candidate division Zixibacteria bacterium]|nr:cation:proton antiporter [candidate division Zixibacteria bacterium]
MTFPSEHDFALFLFQLFILLSAALALGGFLRAVRQAAVVGEIAAGVLLGPSVLGAFAPDLAALLFPPSQTHMLGTIAWLGSIFLLLAAGTEVDLATLRHERRVVATTSVFGIAVPFALGLIFGLLLPESYLVRPEQRWLFALFMAVAMSISAIPLVAKMLMDMNLLKAPVGQVIIGAAVANDLIGWIFFTIILGLLGSGFGGAGAIAGAVAMTLTFAAFCLTAGRTLMARLFSVFHALGFPAEGILGLAVLTTFLCAAVAQWIGVHAIFGAFLAGVMIGETGEIANHTRDTVRGFVLYLFAPLFFASMGLRADFLRHFDVGLVSGMLAVACLGKVLGGSLGAALGGMKRPKALSVAFGLMPQGAMGMILGFLALEYSLINEKVFVALVVTSIATSVASGPLIRWALREQREPLSAPVPARR